MLTIKKSLAITALAALFSVLTACSGEYQSAREIEGGDSSFLPDSAPGHDPTDTIPNY